MKYIEKYNRETMQAGFPELYTRVCRWECADREDQDTVMAVDRTETLTEVDALLVQMRDGTIARLNSAYDPGNEAEIWAMGQSGLSASNLFVFGLGYNGSVVKTKI